MLSCQMILRYKDLVKFCVIGMFVKWINWVTYKCTKVGWGVLKGTIQWVLLLHLPLIQLTCRRWISITTHVKEVRKALEYGKTTKTVDVVKGLCSSENIFNELVHGLKKGWLRHRRGYIWAAVFQLITKSKRRQEAMQECVVFSCSTATHK